MFNLKKIFFYFLPIYFTYLALAGLVFTKQSLMSFLVGGTASIYVTVTAVKYPWGFKIFRPVWLFYLYLFILIFFSTNIYLSFKNYLEAFIPMMLLFISYAFVRDIEDLKKLNKSIIALTALYLINLLLSNIFHLGETGYSEESGWQTGNIFTDGLNSMAYTLLLVPLFALIFNQKRQRIILFVVAAIVFITVLITLKRISIIAIIIGYTTFFLISRKKSVVLKVILSFAVVLYISYPIYENVLQKQLIAREKRLQLDSYETEGRYLEAVSIWEETFSFEDPIKSIFGQEIFNSQGHYGEGAFNNRQIHSDYNLILNGAGILGLLMYLVIHIFFIKNIFKLRKQLFALQLMNPLYETLYATFISYVVISLVISFSGGITSISFNVVKFMYLGAITAIFRNAIKANLYNGISKPII